MAEAGVGGRVAPQEFEERSGHAQCVQPTIVEVGNLDTWRDFLDVRDVCAAYLACIGRRDELAPGAILNVASVEARRIGDVLTQLAEIAGVDVEINVDASRVRDSDIRLACGNAALAKTSIGWAPKIPLEETLHDVLEDWRRRIEATGPI